jgi:hypothetical protein
LAKLTFEIVKLAFEFGPLVAFPPAVVMPPPKIKITPLLIKSLTKPFRTHGIFETTHRFVATLYAAIILFEPIMKVATSAMFNLTL